MTDAHYVENAVLDGTWFLLKARQTTLGQLTFQRLGWSEPFRVPLSEIVFVFLSQTLHNLQFESHRLSNQSTAQPIQRFPQFKSRCYRHPPIPMKLRQLLTE